MKPDKKKVKELLPKIYVDITCIGDGDISREDVNKYNIPIDDPENFSPEDLKYPIRNAEEFRRQLMGW